MEENKSSHPSLPHPSQVALHAYLEAFLDEYGCPRPYTYRTHLLLETLKPKLGEANALLIEGLRQYNTGNVPFVYLSQAKEKGCDHPFLHLYLGYCYSSGDRGVALNGLKALECYDKAIQGMFICCDPQRVYILSAVIIVLTSPISPSCISILYTFLS